MVVFGDGENRAFTQVEGVLSQRLIAWLAEGSDHCGHDKGGCPDGGREPSVGRRALRPLHRHSTRRDSDCCLCQQTLMTMNTRDVP